jgi:hypothetical protein
MNKLKPNAKIISEFKGEIEDCIVDDKDVYYTVLNIIDHLFDFVSIKGISFTKSQNLIADLIEAFTELKQYQAFDRCKYLEDNIIDIIEESTTLEELTTNLNDFVEYECYIVFYGICDRLAEGYYIS